VSFCWNIQRRLSTW